MFNKSVAAGVHIAVVKSLYQIPSSFQFHRERERERSGSCLKLLRAISVIKEK
jgi:hypothetical protein